MATGKLKSPLTEDNVLDIFQDMDGFAVNMSKAKTKLLAKEYDWSDEEKMTKEVPYDLDMSNINVLPHEKRNIEEQWRLIEQCMEFMRIDMSHIDSFINEYADDENDPDYEMFLKYTKGSDLSIEKYIDKFVSFLDEDGVICDYATDYGDQDMNKTEEDNTIITGDWNELASSLYDLIEQNGYDMEWSDEWIMDYHESLLYRASPGYDGSEVGYFWVHDCEISPIVGNEVEYLKTKELEVFPSGQIPIAVSYVDPVEYGYIDIEEACHETGMYGIWENPEETFNEASNEYNSLFFSLCSQGPFAVHWKIFGKKKADE